MSAEDNSTKAKMLQHLDELMGDVDLYRLERVCTYHSVWLNQIQQGRYTWDDNEAKLQFRRVLVWHVPIPAAATASSSGAAKHTPCKAETIMPQRNQEPSYARGSTLVHVSTQQLIQTTNIYVPIASLPSTGHSRIPRLHTIGIKWQLKRTYRRGGEQPIISLLYSHICGPFLSGFQCW